RRPPRPPLLPYTTLFRSLLQISIGNPPGPPPACLGRVARRAPKSSPSLLGEGDHAQHGGGVPTPGQESGPRVTRSVSRSVASGRSEEHTSELQSRENLVC